MFSSKNCNFFHFNFLHQGLCQSIICHRFSILGSLMLEESSATLHSWKSELSSAIENMNFPVQKKWTFQCSNLVTVLDIALQLPFPVIPQAVFFYALMLVLFGDSVWKILCVSVYFFQHYVFFVFVLCTALCTTVSVCTCAVCSWQCFENSFEGISRFALTSPVASLPLCPYSTKAWTILSRKMEYFLNRIFLRWENLVLENFWWN